MRTSTRSTTFSFLAAVGVAAAVVWRSRPAEIVVPERPIPVEIPSWPDLSNTDGPANAWARANDAISSWLSGLLGEAGGLIAQVATWLVSGLLQVLSGIAGGVHALFDAALDVVQETETAIVDAVNVAIDTTANAISTVYGEIDGVANQLYADAADLFGSIDAIWSAIDLLRGSIGADVIDALKTIIDDAVAAVVDPAVAWVETEVGRIEDSVRGLIDDAIGSLDIERLIADALAAAGIITAVEAITRWVEECGDPLCRDLGPGSQLGKALQALKGVLGLIAGVELLHLTEADLERIGRAFAAISEGSLEGFFHGFVEGGESIGEAGAGVVGELTSAGADALRVLGVPIP